jgi:pimeloyl-ACP methyl ester carboxylesterase
VGLSLGGWAAMKFAAAAPERVERLVLLAPGGVAAARKSFLVRALLCAPFGAWGRRQVTKAVFAPQHVPQRLDGALSFLPKTYKPRRNTLPLLSNDELRAVSAPALLIAGVHDALLDMPATAARLRRLMPNVETELDPSLGHAVFGKGEPVVEFLAGLPAATTPR